MALTITSLSWTARKSKSGTPYAIVNCTFRVVDDEQLHAMCVDDSADYGKVLTIDDPNRYEDWIENDWDLQTVYDGFGRSWQIKDPVWEYRKKFDTFWFREWVSDCAITSSIYTELQCYKSIGRLPSVYRGTDEGVVIRHLKALSSYWD